MNKKAGPLFYVFLALFVFLVMFPFFMGTDKFG